MYGYCRIKTNWNRLIYAANWVSKLQKKRLVYGFLFNVMHFLLLTLFHKKIKSKLWDRILVLQCAFFTARQSFELVATSMKLCWYVAEQTCEPAAIRVTLQVFWNGADKVSSTVHIWYKLWAALICYQPFSLTFFNSKKFTETPFYTVRLIKISTSCQRCKTCKNVKRVGL